MNASLILFEFEEGSKAERVMQVGGERALRGKPLHLDWWSPEGQCFRHDANAQGVTKIN